MFDPARSYFTSPLGGKAVCRAKGGSIFGKMKQGAAT